jgi:hypothetical protein
MRIIPKIGEGDPAQVQTMIDNWYAVQTRRRRRPKRGYLRKGGRGEYRSQENNGTHNRSARERQQQRTRQMGLAHMYQYGDTGEVYYASEETSVKHAVFLMSQE